MKWHLRLYVAGGTAEAETALRNLQMLAERHLQGDCTIEVIDLMEHPEKAAEHQILALPTLVRCKPLPMRKVIGDLSFMDRVVEALGLTTRP